MILFIDPYMETNCFPALEWLVPELGVPSIYVDPTRMKLPSLYQLGELTHIVCLGSFSHITDPQKWHTPLANYMETALKRNIPVLGICFGHQLMAHYWGANVDYYDESQEVMKHVREIEVRGLTYELAVSHAQVVKSIPKDSPLKCVSKSRVENDVIIHTQLPYTGLQPHPEMDKGLLTRSIGLGTNRASEVLTSGEHFIRDWMRGRFHS